MATIEHLQRFLGGRKYRHLVDGFLLKQLMEQLYGRGKRYVDVRESIQQQNYILEEETSHLAAQFRAGKIQFSLPQHDFSMTSFYRLALSPGKKDEVEKDYMISHYLAEQGRGEVRVPGTVFTAEGFSATEFIEGSDLLTILDDDSSSGRGQRRHQIHEAERNVLQQVFQYHTLAPERGKVSRILRRESLQEYYGIERLLDTLAIPKKDPGRRIVEEEWGQHLTAFLQQEKQGLLHNDLNNNNIIVGKDGGSTLIDWGDATIGPIHYDICRFLMGTDFFQQVQKKEYDEFWQRLDGKSLSAEEPNNMLRETVLLREISAKIGTLLQEQGYDQQPFVSSFNRAHASIRFRLAGSTYRHVQTISRGKEYASVLTMEERQLVEHLASYHFTQGLEALEREKLHDLARSIDSVAFGQGLEKKSLAWMQEFQEKYDPDISSWAKVKSIEDKLRLVEREKLMQEQDIASLARKRAAKVGILGTLAAVAVLTAGALGYGHYIAPRQERLRQQQETAAALAQSWPQDLMELMLVKDSAFLAKDKSILLPVMVNYLQPAPSDDRFQELQRDYAARHQVKPEFDLKSCLNTTQSFRYCFPVRLFSDHHFAQAQQKWEKQKENALDQCLDKRTILGELVGKPFDFYQGKTVQEVMNVLESSYFVLPGALSAVEAALGPDFTTFLQDTFAASDKRLQLHLLADRLANLTKEHGDLSMAYVSLFTTADEVALTGMDRRTLFYAQDTQIPDAVQPAVRMAREAYFTFLAKNNIDGETLRELDSTELRDYNREIILAKTTDLLGTQDPGELGDRYKRAIKNTLVEFQAQTEFIRSSMDMILKIARTPDAVGSDCERQAIEYGLRCLNPFDEYMRIASEQLLQVHSAAETVFRSAKMKNDRPQFQRALQCNINALQAQRQLYSTGVIDSNLVVMGSIVDQLDNSRRSISFNPSPTDFDGAVNTAMACLEQLQGTVKSCYQGHYIGQDSYNQLADAFYNLRNAFGGHNVFRRE